MIDMRIAMIGWEYPPFKSGGLATHCYGLTRDLVDKNVKVYFFMPKTKNTINSDRPNLVIKEVGETEIFPSVEQPNIFIKPIQSVRFLWENKKKYIT